MDICTQTAPIEAPPLTKGKLYVTENHWTIHREIITRLYRDENRPLKEVKRIMENEYFFYATERMYKTRIKRWGLDKKFKEAEVLAILQLKKQREAAGKKSRFMIRDQEVGWDRVLYYLKRRPDLQKDLGFAAHKQDVDWDRVVQYLQRRPDTQRDLSTALLSEITCRTPSPSPESPRLVEPVVELHFADDIVRMLRDFFNSAFETRQWGVVNNTLCSRGKIASRERLNKWCLIMGDIYELFRLNETQAAVDMLYAKFNMLKWIIKDIDPELAFFHCYIVLGQPKEISDVLLQYVCKMYAMVLGERHPLTLIWRRLWGLSAEDRVHVLSAVVKYSSRHLQERIGLLNVTLNWIHGLQSQLLQNTGELEGNDFQYIVSAYNRASEDYLDRDLRKEACKCLFELAKLHLTAQRPDLARATLGKADEVMLDMERGGYSTDAEELLMWSYGSMGQMNYDTVSLSSLKRGFAETCESAVQSYQPQGFDSLSLPLCS